MLQMNSENKIQFAHKYWAACFQINISLISDGSCENGEMSVENCLLKYQNFKVTEKITGLYLGQR